LAHRQPADALEALDRWARSFTANSIAPSVRRQPPQPRSLIKLPHDSLNELTLEKFSALLGTRFRVHWAAASAIELELAEVTPGPGGGCAGAVVGGARQESFSLIFSGPPAPLLPQQIYRFEHALVAALDLFLVPIAREAQAIKYQAVLNRLAESG